MKKILKIWMISTSIIYFVFSSVVTFYNYQSFQFVQKFLPQQQELGGEKYKEEIEFERGMTYYDKLQESRFEGKQELVLENVILACVSILLGMIIAILNTLKENAKTKYFWYFLFGFASYESILYLIAFVKIPEAHYQKLLTYLVQDIPITFLIYLIFFGILLVIHIFDSKKQAKQLNEQLKQVKLQNEEQKCKKESNKNVFKGMMQNKKLKKGFQLTVIILFAILVIVFGIKIIILYSLEVKASNYTRVDNFKETILINNNYITEIVRLKNRCYKKIYQKDDANFLIEEYDNGKTTNQYMTDSNGVKTAQLGQNYSTDYRLENGLFDYTQNVFYLLKVALLSHIELVEFNGKKCYKISNIPNIGEFHHLELEEVLYIERETGLFICRSHRTSFTDKTISTNQYKYEFGTATEENFQEPNLEQYQIIKDKFVK